ncbi:MAG: DUF1553 domain-containing protein, partial [Acidimicrobiia bacterium]|nr:DUF1553 domain-containing protein [Acidimicrobiia bacterium]
MPSEQRRVRGALAGAVLLVARRSPDHLVQHPHPVETLELDGRPRLELDAGASESRRRLALAEWIAQPDNPLPPRVLVNRLWHWHFGQGFVRTPSDFGANGDRPSHPELLDFLATELRRSGGRLKPL